MVKTGAEENARRRQIGFFVIPSQDTHFTPERRPDDKVVEGLRREEARLREKAFLEGFVSQKTEPVGGMC